MVDPTPICYIKSIFFSIVDTIDTVVVGTPPTTNTDVPVTLVQLTRKPVVALNPSVKGHVTGIKDLENVYSSS